MTLIDCFNTFQSVSKSLKLSANARSLYYAILGEFNSARYPDTLSITNRVLQDMSGIKAESSFFSARNALANAQLIRHKKQVYQLTPDAAMEKLRNRVGVHAESTWSRLGVGLEFSNSTSNSITIPKNRKEIEKTTAAARTREGFLKEISPAIAETWFKYEGERLNGGQMLDLYGLEKIYGADAVVDAIIEASRSNKYPRLSYAFLKAVLEKKGRKGGTDSGTVDNSQYAEIDTF